MPHQYLSLNNFPDGYHTHIGAPSRTVYKKNPIKFKLADTADTAILLYKNDDVIST